MLYTWEISYKLGIMGFTHKKYGAILELLAEVNHGSQAYLNGIVQSKSIP